jgi:exosome complex component RRP4
MTEQENDVGAIVVPGELLDESGRLKPGSGTYRRDGRLYAKRMGLKSERGGEVSIIALGGIYDPAPGDLVVGIVMEHGPSNWLLDINAPYPAPLHVSEVPWKVGFAETAQFMAFGDAVLCKIMFVDETKKIQVTMNDRNLRKLEGGALIEVAPSRVPRVIGKSGSMVNLIKKYTDVWMFVGQNGRIWLNGEPDGVNTAIEAIRKIEREAHIPGLTDRITELLRARTGKTLSDEGDEGEEE